MRKKLVLAVFCSFLFLAMGGCGRKNETVPEAYLETESHDNEGKAKNTSNKMADAASDHYYSSLDELTKQGGGLDISAWEGDDAIDKWSRRIMYWWTNFYASIKKHVVEIMAVNTLTGAMLAIFATKNKQIRRFGLFNLCIYLNSVVLAFVIAVGLVNHFYAG